MSENELAKAVEEMEPTIWDTLGLLVIALVIIWPIGLGIVILQTIRSRLGGKHA